MACGDGAVSGTVALNRSSGSMLSSSSFSSSASASASSSSDASSAIMPAGILSGGWSTSCATSAWYDWVGQWFVRHWVIAGGFGFIRWHARVMYKIGRYAMGLWASRHWLITSWMWGIAWSSIACR
jgi:hypothetical protein